MTVYELIDKLVELGNAGHGEDVVLLECEHDNSYGHLLYRATALDGGMVRLDMDVANAQSVHMYPYHDEEDDE